MMTTGTLGAALSTAIWAAIAGATWAACAARLMAGRRLDRLGNWLLDLVGLALIVLVPQGLRLWGPNALVHRFLPHTLTVLELRLLVKVAAVAGVVGIAAAILGRRLDRDGSSRS